MSDLVPPAGDERRTPRAVVHKNILEEAAAQPDASMQELAEEVPAATTDLVEKVLDEYGDPAAVDDPDATTTEDDAEPQETADADEAGDVDSDGADDTSSSRSQSIEASGGTDARRTTTAATDEQGSMHEPEHDTSWDATVDPDALTEKQRETLEAIADHPEATQAELADLLGVSSATINTRVNSIDGFEWRTRERFVEAVLGVEPGARDPGDEREDGDTDVADVSDADCGAVSRDGEDQYAGTEDEPSGSDETPGGDVSPSRDQPVVESGREVAVRLDGSSPSIRELTMRVEELADRVESLSSHHGAGSDPCALEDPELVHKVLRACLGADHFNDDEEVELVRAFLGPDAGG